MSPGRKSISKKLRFETFKRDGFACQYCGAHPPNVLLHVDHIEAVSGGGTNDPDNLITACESCNLGKGAASLSIIPESLSHKASRIAESEAQLVGYSAIMEGRRHRLDADVWHVVSILVDSEEIERSRYRSIKVFVEKLGVHEVLEAAEIARYHEGRSPYQVFKYFCGICWNKIRDVS